MEAEYQVRHWTINLFGALADFNLLAYDWAFIDQYLGASLMLPLTLCENIDQNYGTDTELQK